MKFWKKERKKKKHAVPSNNSAQLQKTCTQSSILTYLRLSNVFRMRNSVLGMVDATLRYAVKPAWSSVLLPLSEIFAWTSRSLYIQYLKNKVILLLERKHWKWNPHFLNFYCQSAIHSVHSTSHLAKNTLVCVCVGVLLCMQRP